MRSQRLCSITARPLREPPKRADQPRQIPSAKRGAERGSKAIRKSGDVQVTSTGATGLEPATPRRPEVSRSACETLTASVVGQIEVFAHACAARWQPVGGGGDAATPRSLSTPG